MTVDELIVEAFKRVIHLNNEKDGLGGADLNNLQTRLIYPRYGGDRADQIRISEQEIKQTFIEVLNNKKNHNFFYSVECPTENTYIFGAGAGCANCPNGNCPQVFGGDEGISARTDACLYIGDHNIFSRYALIEFKEANPEKREICQDFLKLTKESNYGNNDNKKGYFVLVLNGFETRTKNSLFGNGEEVGKFSNSLDFIREHLGDKILTVYILTQRNAVERDGINRTNGYYKIELKKRFWNRI